MSDKYTTKDFLDDLAGAPHVKLKRIHERLLALNEWEDCHEEVERLVEEAHKIADDAVYGQRLLLHEGGWPEDPDCAAARLAHPALYAEVPDEEEHLGWVEVMIRRIGDAAEQLKQAKKAPRRALKAAT